MIAFVTSPITLTVAAIAALVLGLRYLTGSWEGVLQVLSGGTADFKTLQDVWTDLTSIGGDLKDALSSIGSIISENLSPIIRDLKDLATDLGLRVKDPLTTNIQGLNAASSTAGDDGLPSLTEAIGFLWQVITPTQITLFGGFSKLLHDVAAGAKNASAWLRYFAGTGEYAAGAVAAAVPDYRNFLGVADGVQGTLAAAGIASGVFGDSMGRLAVGGGAVVRSLADVKAGAEGHARATTASAEATKKAAEAAKKAAEEYQKLRDAMTGKDTIAKAEQMARVLADLTFQGLKPSAAGAREVADAMNDAADVLRSQSRKIPDWMGTIWAAVQPPTEVVDDLRNWGDLFGRSISRLIPTLKNNLKPMQAALLQAFQIPIRTSAPRSTSSSAAPR